MEDQDSKASAPAHTPGARRGEEIGSGDGKESGRHEAGASHEDRPVGGRTARDSTSINPESEESGPESTNMPPS